MQATPPPGIRRLSQEAVEAAIEQIAHTRLKPQADSMLRTFLAFKAVSADGTHDAEELREVVGKRFTVLPTPAGVDEATVQGTLRLRGSQGGPSWMKNDSWRGSFQDYVGPTSGGRMMFQAEDWRNAFVPDAVDLVANTLGPSNQWPARDALAAIALRNEALDSSWGWDEIADHARSVFGLSTTEWAQITGAPALGVEPFGGDPWDVTKLAAELRPPGSEKNDDADGDDNPVHPPQLAAAINRVLATLQNQGHRAIIALAGVPGTSKSYVARIAARAYASEECLREIQFSPGYTYEEFMEGPRFGDNLKVTTVEGAFLELNNRALRHPEKQYVLLVEEFSRADLPKVLGELLTYVEYRDEDDKFTTMYSRDRTERVAPNLAILATYNPTDRSAVTIDAAIIRRLRILSFPPDIDLLREILSDNGLDEQAIDKLVEMFVACKTKATPDRFDEAMPFGHAVFSAVETEADLHDLWHEELKQLMLRPWTPPHELFETIRDHYPWRAGPNISVVQSAAQSGSLTTQDIEA
jgi:5-methylcytosine-specific restriction protein B